MRRSTALAVLLVAITATAAAAATSHRPAGGDALLARAVTAPGLRDYAVPVDFAVHLHKPIGLRSKVEGTAYYQKPAHTALLITKASGIVGGFFKGAYNLDMVPQAWPQQYHVTSASAAIVGGVPVELLTAKPRGSAGGDLDQIVITLAKPALAPVAADWHYRDGSSIHLAYTNARIGPYMLPQTATISVDMPHYKLDADATYGNYAINAPVDDTVFANAK